MLLTIIFQAALSLGWATFTSGALTCFGFQVTNAFWALSASSSTLLPCCPFQPHSALPSVQKQDYRLFFNMKVAFTPTWPQPSLVLEHFHHLENPLVNSPSQSPSESNSPSNTPTMWPLSARLAHLAHHRKGSTQYLACFGGLPHCEWFSSSAPSTAQLCSLWDTPSLFLYSPVDGHLGHFQCLAIMNEAVMNILVQGFCGLMFSFLLNKYLRVEWLGHWVDVYSTFLFLNCPTAKWDEVHP